MSTLSVPIPAQLEIFINNMVRNGDAANKADVVRKALYLLEQEEAIRVVLESEREPVLRGNLRDLMEKIK
ncbi:MAG: hypothetical protein A2749_00875 [Parcubacteria group bacterium RIFCSPHIGHO2_01_FULL_45_26]|nr:MAG: hypothetical protein A2749_00875 [Parcubacteria group bacterium RIFCSPHIGHO2_01_FULL_45_26]